MALIPLLKTALHDPHIVKVMAHFDKTKQVELQAEIIKKMIEFADLASKSPVLYEAALDNIVETTLFRALEHHEITPPQKVKVELNDKGEIVGPATKDTPPERIGVGEVVKHPNKYAHVPGAPVWNLTTSNKLFERIKAESPSFFPLRNMIDFKRIHDPRIIYVPSDKESNKKYNDIDTAAATRDGVFIFNIHFMNQLLGFAHLKGLTVAGNKGHSKKYESHGGPFPDAWEYIEFVIRHEFMHYTYSDFHYNKIILDDLVAKANLPTPKERNALRRKESGKVGKYINYTGDYRTNHNLVQHGFNQLPMSLFSAYVNFHKQYSYMEMYELVKSEMEKLSEEQKKQLEEQEGDDHSQQGTPSDGEGEPGEGDEPEDGDGEPGEGKGKDRGANGKPLTPEEIDAHNKKMDEVLKADAKKSAEGDIDNSDKKASSDGSPGTGIGNPTAINFSKIRPKYKWDELLRKMVTETGVTIETTYQKISRRSITSSHQIKSIGAGAVKPGEQKIPNRKKLKLCVIIDSSGSMGGVIEKVMTNLDNLLVKRSNTMKLDQEFYVFMFSGTYDKFVCKPGTGGTAVHIDDIKTGKLGKIGTVPLKNLFGLHMAGGTVFSSELSGEAQELAARGYNVLVITDGDLLGGSNFDNWLKLYKAHRKQVWLMLDCNETYVSYVKAMGGTFDNATHL